MKVAAMLVALTLGGDATDGFRDDFDGGLCVGACPGARWGIVQQVNGRVTTTPAPDRAGRALRVVAGPKRGNIVGKADVVARLDPVPAGGRIDVAFDLRVPAGTPLDSLQLLDIECASCGEGGNPGVRLYLRRGRLRVDRSKIGIRHAWTNEAAPMLRHDRWHRIDARFALGTGEGGGVRVLLDGREVLRRDGATLARLPRIQADRVQLGITANSNAVPAAAWVDDVQVTVAR